MIINGISDEFGRPSIEEVKTRPYLQFVASFLWNQLF